MAKAARIAIDAMGGDTGVAVMLAGAAHASTLWPDLEFVFVGEEGLIRAEIAKHPRLASAQIVHAPDVIAGEERPTQAIRRAKTTSVNSVAVNWLP